MKLLASSYTGFRFILFTVLIMLCSSHAYTQTEHKFLYIPTESDGPDNSSNKDEDPEPPKTTVVKKPTQKQRVYEYIFADIGTSSLRTNVNGLSSEGDGLNLALCGQLAIKLNSMNADNQTFLSTGLELRNFNCTFNNAQGSSTADHLHFWYVGIPVMFQFVNTKKHNADCENDINYYVQAGCTFGYQVSMSQSRDDIGSETSVDQNQNYNKFIVQPFLSAGISYTTQRKICLIGPYVTYGINNMSSQTGITENIYSYGIRLTELLFR